MDKFEKITGLAPAEAGFILASGAIIEVIDGVVSGALTALSPSLATMYATAPFSETLVPILIALAGQHFSKNKHVKDACEGLLAGALVNVGQDLAGMLSPAPATTAAVAGYVQGPAGQAGFGRDSMGRIVQGARGQTGFGRIVQGARGQTGFGKLSAKARKASFRGGDMVLDDGNVQYLSNGNDYDNSQTAQAACSSIESDAGTGGSEDGSSTSMS